MKRNISVEMNTSGHLPDITYDYVQDKKLKKFYGRSFKIKNFKNQIFDKRNFSDEKRKILVEVLKDQNKDLKLSGICLKNLKLINKKTTFYSMHISISCN